MDCCPMPQSVSRTENNKSSALSTLGKVLLMWVINQINFKKLKIKFIKYNHLAL